MKYWYMLQHRPWEHHAKWKKAVTRTGRFTETQSGLQVFTIWGKNKWEWLLTGIRFLSEVTNISEMGQQWYFHNSVTTGKTTELYILKGKFYGMWIVSQVNYHLYILIRIRKSNFWITTFEKEIETLKLLRNKSNQKQIRLLKITKFYWKIHRDNKWLQLYLVHEWKTSYCNMSILSNI